MTFLLIDGNTKVMPHRTLRRAPPRSAAWATPCGIERHPDVKPPRPTPFPNETALSGAAQERIRKVYGGEVLKVHGNAAGKKGTPDLLACIGGRFVAIELKQPGQHPTPLQAKRLREWAAAGAVVGCVHDEVELDALCVPLLA